MYFILFKFFDNWLSRMCRYTLKYIPCPNFNFWMWLRNCSCCSTLWESRIRASLYHSHTRTHGMWSLHGRSSWVLLLLLNCLKIPNARVCHSWSLSLSHLILSSNLQAWFRHFSWLFWTQIATMLNCFFPHPFLFPILPCALGPVGEAWCIWGRKAKHSMKTSTAFYQSSF